MSTIKISQLPILPNISSNTTNTLFMGVDIPSGVTGKFTATTLSQQLYANNYLVVGQNYSSVFSNTIGQFSGSDPEFIQVNLQNFNPAGSGDYIVTADTGTNSNSYIDMGIGNSLQTGNNSGFNALESYDGYLYVQGPTLTGAQGNLIIGTASANANIYFVAGGVGTLNANDIVAWISDDSFSLNSTSYLVFGDGTTQFTAAASNAYSQAAYALANSAIQNTSGTMSGTLTANVMVANTTMYANVHQANTSVNTAIASITGTTYTGVLQANTSVNTAIASVTGTLYVNNILANNTVNVSGPVLFGSGSISANGNSNTTATLVVADNTYISGGTGGVILPTAVIGREISITNSTASSITVYPGSGASIELLAANQGVSLPSYATLAVVAKSASSWWATTYIFTGGSNISLTQGGSGSITINSTDTLNSIVNRGNTTSSNITVNGVTANTINVSNVIVNGMNASTINVSTIYLANTTINNGVSTTANITSNNLIVNTSVQTSNIKVTSTLTFNDGSVQTSAAGYYPVQYVSGFAGYNVNSYPANTRVFSISTTGTGTVNMYLPSIANTIPGKTYEFVDATGNAAGAKPYVINRANGSSDTISGATSQSITTSYGHLTVIATANSWLII